MCGRYKLTVSWAEIVRLYNLTNSVNLAPRWNIAPSQDVLAVVYDAAARQRRGEMFRWGLVPSWAKDAKLGYSLINARAETVASKPAFREAFRKRRCIVPADAFYEWQPVAGAHVLPLAPHFAVPSPPSGGEGRVRGTHATPHHGDAKNTERNHASVPPGRQYEPLAPRSGEREVPGATRREGEGQPIARARKQPYAVVMQDRSVFGFAGLWEQWTDKASGEVVRSCTIIVTAANALLAPIHDRMPVILDPADYARWLGEAPGEPAALQALLKPYPAERMACFKIGPKIGNVKYDEPGLVEPV